MAMAMTSHDVESSSTGPDPKCEYQKLDQCPNVADSNVPNDWETRGSNGDYPRGYEVYVAKGSLGQGQLAAKGKGTQPLLEIKFAKPVAGKSIKIVQTGSTGGLFWSIHELEVRSKPLPK